jgi:hypothetical protein
MKHCLGFFILLFTVSKLFGQGDSVRLELTTTDEYWWVGVTNHGHLMPVSPGYTADLFANIYGNQGQPLLLSSRGRVVWSDEHFAWTAGAV